MDTWESVNYILQNNIKGDFVECGVETGDQPIKMIQVLMNHNQTRKIWMYDTFKGLTKPTEHDFTSESATLYKMSKDEVMSQWKNSFINDETNGWCYTPIDTVKKNINKTNYPEHYLNYIVGDVLVTLDNEDNLPKEISLLRLDTDWYESSLKEMEVLYPRVVIGGVIILDDYFHWDGQRKATDEYLNKLGINIEIKKHNEKVGYFIKEK